jgi:hypothetical protein
MDMPNSGAPGAPPSPLAPPPAGGAAPGLQIPQAGLEAQAKKDVKDALSKLKGALPRLKAGSETEKAVLKALNALSTVASEEGEDEKPAGAPMGKPMGGPAPAPGAGPGGPMPIPGARG